jgi:hypothetical protein
VFGIDQNEELDALVDVVEGMAKGAGIVVSKFIWKIEYMLYRIFGKGNMIIAVSD